MGHCFPKVDMQDYLLFLAKTGCSPLPPQMLTGRIGHEAGEGLSEAGEGMGGALGQLENQQISSQSLSPRDRSQ